MLLIISRNEDRPELESKILAAAFRQSVERGDIDGSRLAHRELVGLLARKAKGALNGADQVETVFASDNVGSMDLQQAKVNSDRRLAEAKRQEESDKAGRQEELAGAASNSAFDDANWVDMSPDQSSSMTPISFSGQAIVENEWAIAPTVAESKNDPSEDANRRIDKSFEPLNAEQSFEVSAVGDSRSKNLGGGGSRSGRKLLRNAKHPLDKDEAKGSFATQVRKEDPQDEFVTPGQKDENDFAASAQIEEPKSTFVDPVKNPDDGIILEVPTGITGGDGIILDVLYAGETEALDNSLDAVIAEEKVSETIAAEAAASTSGSHADFLDHEDWEKTLGASIGPSLFEIPGADSTSFKGSFKKQDTPPPQPESSSKAKLRGSRNAAKAKNKTTRGLVKPKLTAEPISHVLEPVAEVLNDHVEAAEVAEVNEAPSQDTDIKSHFEPVSTVKPNKARILIEPPVDSEPDVEEEIDPAIFEAEAARLIESYVSPTEVQSGFGSVFAEAAAQWIDPPTMQAHQAQAESPPETVEMEEAVPSAPEAEALEEAVPSAPETEALEEAVPSAPETEALEEAVPSAPETEALEEAVPSAPETEALEEAVPSAPEAEVLEEAVPSAPEVEAIDEAEPSAPEVEVMEEAVPSAPEAEVLEEAVPSAPDAEELEEAVPTAPEVEVIDEAAPHSPSIFEVPAEIAAAHQAFDQSNPAELHPVFQDPSVPIETLIALNQATAHQVESAEPVVADLNFDADSESVQQTFEQGASPVDYLDFGADSPGEFGEAPAPAPEVYANIDFGDDDAVAEQSDDSEADDHDVSIAAMLAQRPPANPDAANYYGWIGAESTDPFFLLHVCYLRAVRAHLLRQFLSDNALNPHEFKRQLKNMGIAFNILLDPRTRLDYDLRQLGLREPIDGNGLVVPADAKLPEAGGKAKIAYSELMILCRIFDPEQMLAIVNAARLLGEHQFWDYLGDSGLLTQVELDSIRSGYQLICNGLISINQFEQGYQYVRANQQQLVAIMLTAGWLRIEDLEAFANSPDQEVLPEAPKFVEAVVQRPVEPTVVPSLAAPSAAVIPPWMAWDDNGDETSPSAESDDVEVADEPPPVVHMVFPPPAYTVDFGDDETAVADAEQAVVQSEVASVDEHQVLAEAVPAEENEVVAEVIPSEEIETVAEAVPAAELEQGSEAAPVEVLEVGSEAVPSEELEVGSGAIPSEDLEVGSEAVPSEELEVGSGAVPSEELEVGSGAVPSEELEVGSASVPSEELEVLAESLPVDEHEATSNLVTAETTEAETSNAPVDQQKESIDSAPTEEPEVVVASAPSPPPPPPTKSKFDFSALAAAASAAAQAVIPTLETPLNDISPNGKMINPSEQPMGADLSKAVDAIDDSLMNIMAEIDSSIADLENAIQDEDK